MGISVCAYMSHMTYIGQLELPGDFLAVAMEPREHCSPCCQYTILLTGLKTCTVNAVNRSHE